MKESNLSEIFKKIQKNSQEITKIKKKLNKLTSPTFQGDVSQFDIKTEEEWDFIKRKLYETGIFLEQEIQDYLREMGIKFESNYQFEYPSSLSKYYIDRILEDRSRQRGRTEQIKMGEFETDIIALEYKKFSDQNFEIKVEINYIFECKSRNNPPVNYLVIPSEGPNYKIFGSTFLPMLEIKDNDIISSYKNPIGIQYGNLSIDSKETFWTAFWQLFRTIDELCHYNIGYGTYFLYENLPEDFWDEIKSLFENQEYDYTDLEVIYKIMSEKAKYPCYESEKIRISIQLYVPIIVVNGNIYKLNLKNISSGNLKYHVEKIPSFIQRFSVLKISGTKRKYYCYEQLLFHFLQKYSFAHEFGSNIHPEIMPILCISSLDFKKTFTKFKEKVEYQLEQVIREKMKNLYLDNMENIKKFKTFVLFFWYRQKWRETLNDKIYNYLEGL